jgi:ribosomal protein S18 acetylase RimI-like enzyme
MKFAENAIGDGFITYFIRPREGLGPLEVGIVIRWMRPRDMRGIVRLVRTQLVPVSPWHHPRDSRLHSEIASRLREGCTLVASNRRSEEPFAFLHLVVQDSVLFIDLLAVDTSKQNRHWGTELMARAEEYGVKKGCRKAMLFVDEENDRAHRFYNRLGYTTIKHVSSLRCYRLEKPLGRWW